MRKGGLASFAIAFQLSIVAVGAYHMLGCGPPELDPDETSYACTDTSVTVHPGGCADIGTGLGTNCGATVWNSANSSTFLLKPVFPRQFYTLGGPTLGGGADDLFLCAYQWADTSYDNEPVEGSVTFNDPANDDASTTISAYLLVTVDGSRICNRDLCIRASIDQTDPALAPDQARLSVVVDAPAPYTIFWTADRAPSGITPGDEDESSLVVTVPNGDTMYIVQVWITSDVRRAVSDRVFSTYSGGNLPPVATDDSAEVAAGSDVTINLAGNDSDAEDGLDRDSIEIVSPPVNGSVTVNSGGTVTYTHDGSETVDDVFTYTIRDDLDAPSNIATVDITVTPPSDAPVAADDSDVVDEGGTVAIDLAGNDSDPDGALNLASIAIDSGPANGSVAVHSDGTVTYTHNGSETVDDVFTYTIRDQTGTVSNVARVDIAVTPVNDAPVAVRDTGVVAPGGEVRIELAANDGDADSELDPRSIQIVVMAKSGSVTPNGDGSATYRHLGGEALSDSFSYTILDDGGEISNEAAVDITVTPVARNDSAVVSEGGAVTIDLAGNDSDADGALNLASIVITSAPANGSVVVGVEGTVTYTHDGSETVDDVFSYTIENASKAVSNAATVTITVTPVNDAPIADAGDAFGVRLNRQADLDGSGSSDPDDAPLPLSYQWTFASVADGSALTDASIANADQAQASFLPDVVGRYVLRLRVFDGAAAAIDTVSVTAGNTAPRADADAYSINEDRVLIVAAPGVLANDGDLEGDPITAVLVSDVTDGTLVLNLDGSFTYTPNGDFNGDDSFTYRANDGDFDSVEATVTITVDPINDAPTAEPDAYKTDEDVVLDVPTPVHPGLLANDRDVDGDDLTVAVVEGSGPANGTLTLNPDGTFRYVPNPDYNGPDGFSYTVTDDTEVVGPVAVAITVTPVVDLPRANAGADFGVRVGRVANLNGSASFDPDSGAPLASFLWTFASVPAGSARTNGDIASATSALASFTPDVLGTYTLNLEVSNGPDTGSDSVDVVATNAAPAALSDSYDTDEDITLSVPAPGPLGNDSDADGDALSAVLSSDVASGTLTLNPDGSFDYVPGPDFEGSDGFSYRASDVDSESADTIVSITVNPINDAPTADADTYTVDEDAVLDVLAGNGVLANDGDVDSDVLAVALVADVANGTLTLSPDGSFSYTPNANFNGTDGFSYTATDGIETTAETAVEITVAPVADPPLASAGADLTVRVNRLVSLDGSASSDPDSGGPLASFLWTFVSVPAGSALTNADLAGATTALASFTPDVVGTYTLNLEVSNGLDSASDQVDVTAGNAAPVSLSDSYELDEDGTLSVPAPGTLANDSDAEGDPISASLVSDATSGVLVFNPDGSFAYTPNGDFNGSDSFSYAASDGDLTGAPTLVTITVRPVNDPPTASPDAYSVDEDATLTVAAAQGVLANDADPDGDVLSATLVDDVANGSLALAADGSFVYTPADDFNGTDSFTYTTGDGTVSTAPTTATITVDPVNDAPVANAGADLDEGVGRTIALDGTGSSDVDGDTLAYAWSFAAVPPGSAATITDATSASASFVPDISGQYTVQLVVNDGTVDSAPDTAVFLITFCSPLTVRWVPNASGQWTEPTNWSTGLVPGPADDACIDVPADITVTHSTGASDSVRSLVSNEHIILSNGSLSIAMPSVIYQTFTQSGGILTGTGNLTVQGLLIWSGGTQSGTGQTIGNGGMSLAVGTKSLSGRTLVNPVGRTVSWSAGPISSGDGAVFVNNGTLGTTFDGSFVYNLGGVRTVFTNNGTFEKTGGTGTSIISVTLDNTASGIVRASSGLIELNGGGASAGLIDGAGTIVFGGGTTEVSGVYATAGATRIETSAVVNFNAPATVTSLGALRIDSGTANFSNSAEAVAASLVHTGGDLVGPGRLRVTGLMTWSGGTQSGGGQTIAAGGMTLGGTAKWLSGRTVVNPVGQTATWSAGQVNSGDGGVFVNDGTFLTTFDGFWQHNLGGVRAVFRNNGTLAKTAGTGTTQLSFTLDNTATGVVRASSGLLELNGGGASAGLFEGVGTIVFGGGTTDVNGVVDMTGGTVVETSAVVNFNASATVTDLGALSITSGTANFSNSAEAVAAALELTGGDLVGPGRLRVTGLMTWSGGTQSGGGQTIAAGGMTLGGTAKWLSGRTVVNPVGQTATWSAGQVNSGDGGVFVNDGTFLTTFDGFWQHNLGGVRAVFRNNGTLAKTAGTGTTQLSFTLDNTATGVVRASSGLLELNGGGASAGLFEGVGTIVFGGGTTDVDGVVAMAGGTVVETSAVVNFNAPAIVTSLGALTIASGVVNFSNTAQANASALVQTGGDLTGPGALRVTGSMTWSGGTQSGAGQTIGAGGMTLSGTATKSLSGRTIVNELDRTAVWSQGVINSGDGGVFVNDGTFRTTVDGLWQHNLGGVRAVFRNNGTFEKSGGTGATSLAATLDNTATGVVRASSGLLELNAGGTSAGRFEGAATLVFGGMTMDVTGVHDVTGTTRVDGGSTIVNFNPPATVTNLATLELVAGTLNFSTGTPIGVGALTQTGGTLIGADTVTVAGSIGWSGGTQSGPGQTIGNGGMTFTGSGRTISGRTIVNPVGQTVEWTAGPINSGDGGAFVNGGTFRIAFDGVVAFSQGGARTAFTNTGTFEKTGGTGTSGIGFVFGNTGVVRSAAAVLSFTGGYTQTAGTTELAGGAINGVGSGLQGGSLIGSGSLTGGLSSTGTIAPAFNGPLALTGTFAQSGAGALEIDLAGTGTPGTDYDQLTVSQAATLGGALNVSLANGFTPSSGDSFTIMTYSSVTGSFASQSLPPLGGGLSWDVSVGPTAVTLSVVP